MQTIDPVAKGQENWMVWTQLMWRRTPKPALSSISHTSVKAKPDAVKLLWAAFGDATLELSKSLNSYLCQASALHEVHTAEPRHIGWNLELFLWSVERGALPKAVLLFAWMWNSLREKLSPDSAILAWVLKMRWILSSPAAVPFAVLELESQFSSQQQDSCWRKGGLSSVCCRFFHRQCCKIIQLSHCFQK